MNISLKAMQLYVAVLELGSFSEVARREQLSASSVSRIIQQIETTLGFQLLYRNTRTVVPTEAGTRYGDSFRRMLETLNQTTQVLLDQQAEPAGLVRINAPVVFGHKHIAPWLGELAQRYPRLCIELMQTDDFIDPFNDAADLLFRIGPLQDSGLHVRVVDQSEYVLAASPDYLARCGTPQTPADLLTHNCLVYKGVRGPQRSFFSKQGAASEVHGLQGSLLSNNAETLVNAALAGTGVVMMPDWLIGEWLRQGRLVRVLADYPVSASPEALFIAMLYPHTRFMPLNVRTVIDFFAEVFGSPPYWKLPQHQ